MMYKCILHVQLVLVQVAKGLLGQVCLLPCQLNHEGRRCRQPHGQSQRLLTSAGTSVHSGRMCCSSVSFLALLLTYSWLQCLHFAPGRLDLSSLVLHSKLSNSPLIGCGGRPSLGFEAMR